MRIALINPKTDAAYPQPPLGLLSIGTACLAAGHTVSLIDRNAEKVGMSQLLNELDWYDTVGITAMSLNYKEAEKIAAAIRKEYSRKYMVIGGVHATVAAGEVWQSGLYDAVVTGDGELAFPELLLTRGKGIIHGQDAVLDEIPTLAYALLCGRRAKMSYGRHNDFMPIITSRGCPFHCSFCCRIFGNKYRAMSVDKVTQELMRIRDKYHYREVKFYDDVFTMDKARAVEIANWIGGSMDWTCMTRVNLVDRPTLKALKDGGCYFIAYGIESGDPDVLKGISKNIRLEQVEQAVRYSHEVGLKVIGYFMLGAPGETLEAINRTVDFAIKLKVDYAQFSIATALPGSELYELVPSELRANAYALNGVDNPSLCELTPAELKRAVRQAEKRVKRNLP